MGAWAFTSNKRTSPAATSQNETSKPCRPQGSKMESKSPRSIGCGSTRSVMRWSRLSDKEVLAETSRSSPCQPCDFIMTGDTPDQ
jgi:hypothetical protein